MSEHINMNQTIQISNQFVVRRFHKGIILEKPNKKMQTDRTVSSFLKLQCSVYFETSDGVIQAINEHNAEFCGYDSASNAVGKCYYDKFTSQTKDQLRINDNFVMREGIQFIDEIVYREYDQVQHLFSIKSPWYDC